LDDKDKEKVKFKLNLLNLHFLGEQLDAITIEFYPIFIIEFINGYYTSKELFEKNNILIEYQNTIGLDSIKNDVDGNKLINSFEQVKREDIMETDEGKDENKEMSKSQSTLYKVKKFNSEDKIDKANKMENERSVSFAGIIDIEIDKTNEKNNKSKGNTKNKAKSEPLQNKEKNQNCEDFIIYLGLYNEIIGSFNDRINENENLNKINYKPEDCNDIIEIYKRKDKLNKIQLEKDYYKNKSEDIKKVKEKLQKIIANKKNNLNNLKEKINSYKEYLSNLEKSNKESSSLTTQQKILYNSFLNKKMIEICFVFFNKKVQNLYLIKDTLKENLKQDNESIKKRFEFYNSNKKGISSMIGFITHLMIYMSKCFDITLPFPLCLNGSKSFIVRGKKDKEKDFLPLHCDLKREDKYGNFETGLNYLKYDLKEIINFSSMFQQIISEKDYNKLFQDKENNMFFYFFINFNHCLLEFVKNIQKLFDKIN